MTKDRPADNIVVQLIIREDELGEHLTREVIENWRTKIALFVSHAYRGWRYISPKSVTVVMQSALFGVCTYDIQALVVIPNSDAVSRDALSIAEFFAKVMAESLPVGMHVGVITQPAQACYSFAAQSSEENPPSESE